MIFDFLSVSLLCSKSPFAYVPFVVVSPGRISSRRIRYLGLLGESYNGICALVDLSVIV
jgi:hypothetical protein